MADLDLHSRLVRNHWATHLWVQGWSN